MTKKLFVVDLTYVVPLEKVNAFLEPHRAFLKAQYEAGLFLASGPKEPRTGGVILAKAESRESIETAIAKDPFKMEALAEYAITEFAPVMAAKGFPLD